MNKLEQSHWAEHTLTAGILHLKAQPDQPNAHLFRLAERINPKRAFLFVSTVLGRHIPVAPRDHRRALKGLAAKISDQILPGPVMVMGYAETAVGLGAGIHQELQQMYPDRAVGYMSTTRFEPSECSVWFRIKEPHSHASDHSILTPAADVMQDGASSTLVLVDDETTTGTTFRNLATKLCAAGKYFDRIVLATLTDWSEGSCALGIQKAIPDSDVVAVSLYQGAWRWEPLATDSKLDFPAPIPAECPIWKPTGVAPLEVPRFGLSNKTSERMPPSMVERISCDIGLGGMPKYARILIIGSGEHVWEPFLFAEAIAANHPSTHFVTTTRSPILLGETIQRKITFSDHYGLGLPMYLHNVDPSDWDAIVLFNETGVSGVSALLAQALGKFACVDQNAQTTLYKAPALMEIL